MKNNKGQQYLAKAKTKIPSLTLLKAQWEAHLTYTY